jgi:hypothetical protein
VDISLDMSVPGMQIAHLSPEQIKKEIASLQKELRKVEDDIIALRHYLHGLSLTVGEEHFSAELLRLVHPKRTNARGLSRVCRSFFQSAPDSHSVRDICNHIMANRPELLIHRRNPSASVTSVLRHLAKRGEIIRKKENGKSVWLRASWWLTDDRRR